MAVRRDILALCDEICGRLPGDLRREDLLVVGSSSLVMRGIRDACKDVDIQLPSVVGILQGNLLPGPYRVGQISIYYELQALDIFLDSDVRASYPEHPDHVMAPARQEFVRRTRLLREWEIVDGVRVITPRSYHWLQKLNQQLLYHLPKWSADLGFLPEWDREYDRRLGQICAAPYGLTSAQPYDPRMEEALWRLRVVNRSDRVLPADERSRLYTVKRDFLRILSACGGVPQFQLRSYRHFCTVCGGAGYEDGGRLCCNCDGRGDVPQLMLQMWCAAGREETVLNLPARLVDFPLNGKRLADDHNPLVKRSISPGAGVDVSQLLGELETRVQELRTAEIPATGGR